MSIEYGLSVEFDGKKYVLMEKDNIREYPIGGLICEYCRLAPTKLKEIILGCSGLDREVTPDNAADLVVEFHDKLLMELPPAMSSMITAEFQNLVNDWMMAIKENCVETYVTDCFVQDEMPKYKAVADFIFSGTDYDTFGCETLLQMMLSCYFSFAQSYITVKHIFLKISTAETQDELDEILSVYNELYGSRIDFQHIDFRIVAIKGMGLTPLYTFHSALSLLLFETAYIIKTDQKLMTCQNCKNIFVPEGRSDAVYCTYTSPQCEEKTCREIGAQVARANKEKNDVVTREYRKAYMRWQMKVKRHPANKEMHEKFESLTEGMKSWRVKLADGSDTTEKFLDWMKQF